MEFLDVGNLRVFLLLLLLLLLISRGVGGIQNCNTSIVPVPGAVYTVQQYSTQYRRICGDRKLSNRLTSASAPNTNKTYGGNLAYG